MFVFEELRMVKVINYQRYIFLAAVSVGWMGSCWFLCLWKVGICDHPTFFIPSSPQNKLFMALLVTW